MSKKLTGTLLVVAALAFGGAAITPAVEGHFNESSKASAAREAGQVSPEQRTGVINLKTELKTRYDVQFNDKQALQLLCTDGFFGQSCYSGPTDSDETYGSTRYTKESGKTVTINLHSDSSGAYLTEDANS
jgi:hypothetical protein